MILSTDTKLMFYQNGKLMTVRGDRSTRTAFRAGHQPLAETSTDIQCHPLLLFTDGKGSALTTKSSQQSESHAHSPYGHTSPPSRTLTNFQDDTFISSPPKVTFNVLTLRVESFITSAKPLNCHNPVPST